MRTLERGLQLCYSSARAGSGLVPTVAIFGAGPIGLTATAQCKAAGAAKVIAFEVSRAASREWSGRWAPNRISTQLESTLSRWSWI